MFEKAKGKTKRLKMLLWGPTGAGKTVLSLQFPQPCVLDLERGTDQYGDVFDFGVEKPGTWQALKESIYYLAKGEHEYRTLVIDPVSNAWEMCQEEWERRLRAKKRVRDSEPFKMGLDGWGLVKRDWRGFIHALYTLDMNVIATSRIKTTIVEDGDKLVRGDSVPSGEKDLPYEFDVVCQLWCERINGEKVFKAETTKDRTNRLPAGEFEFSPKLFLQLLDGGGDISRKALATQLPGLVLDTQATDADARAKAERTDLISEIKGLFAGWSDHDIHDFKVKHVGTGDSQNYSLVQFRKLRDALVATTKVPPADQAQGDQGPKAQAPQTGAPQGQTAPSDGGLTGRPRGGRHPDWDNLPAYDGDGKALGQDAWSKCTGPDCGAPIMFRPKDPANRDAGFNVLNIRGESHFKDCPNAGQFSGRSKAKASAAA